MYLENCKIFKEIQKNQPNHLKSKRKIVSVYLLDNNFFCKFSNNFLAISLYKINSRYICDFFRVLLHRAIPTIMIALNFRLGIYVPESLNAQVPYIHGERNRESKT